MLDNGISQSIPSVQTAPVDMLKDIVDSGASCIPVLAVLFTNGFDVNQSVRRSHHVVLSHACSTCRMLQ